MIWRQQPRRFLNYCDRMPTRRLVILLTVVTALGATPLLSVWQVAKESGNEVKSLKNFDALAPAPVTALLSARRVPQTLIDLETTARVTTKLDELSANLPQDSCLTVNTDKRVVYQLRPNKSLIPGSNMKLLTAAVALDVLGADKTFSTKILGIVAGNAVRGDLWLVGSGDPLLSTAPYLLTEKYPTMFPTYVEQLVDALVALGVTSIQGSVIGDETLYDAERYVPSWGDGIRSTEAGPLGALMINDANVTSSPVKLPNPALGAATELTRLLNERGIIVRDSPGVGKSSVDTPLIANIESTPLKNIVAELLTNSDNNTAELLLKEIGRVGQGAATRIDGLQVIAAKIVEWGLPTQGVAFLDGSGLDRGNLVTCNLLTSLIERFGQESDLVNAMALAGTTGTLRDVFLSGPAFGVMRGKTGTLNGVKALTGLFPFSSDHATTFTLLLNGPGTSTIDYYRPLWTSVVNAVANGQNSIDISLVEPLTQQSAP